MFNHKEMEYRRLGNTGLKVSAIGYGNMVNSHPDRVDVDDSIVLKCLEKGINFFDTAEVYSHGYDFCYVGQSEKALGRALKKSNVNRSDIVVSTKIFRIGTNVNTAYNLNRKHVVESVDDSLNRLDLDYVDIVFAHSFDQYTPMEEICRGFNKVIEDGKAFYWGTSKWSAENIFEAFGVCDRLGLHRPVAEQCKYSMLARNEMQVEFETLFDKYNYGTTVFSPLAGGFLTGKYFDGIPVGSRMEDPKYLTADHMKKLFYEPYNNPKTIQALREIQQIAKELGSNLTQVALAWVLRNQDVSTAIIGASQVSQIDDCLGSLQLLEKWTPELEQRINTVLDTTPTPKFNWGKFQAGTSRRAEQPKTQ